MSDLERMFRRAVVLDLIQRIPNCSAGIVNAGTEEEVCVSSRQQIEEWLRREAEC